jgi:uncharacterized membrane protein
VSLLSLILVLISESCAIAGQVFFKLAMSKSQGRKAFLTLFLTGVAIMTVGFFLWVGLLSGFPLSKLYPFDGLSRILLVFAAMIFLKEEMTPALWIGVALITAGVVVVSAS